MTVQLVRDADGNATGSTPTLDDTIASYAADRAKILARLRRLEGQVRGVQRMVEEDKYCVEILTQLSSIIAASRAVGMLVLEDHVRGCVVHAKDPEAMITELTDAIERFTRTVG